MKREIKFKAWDIRNKKMVHKALQVSETKQLITVNTDYFNSDFSFFDGCKWMQYTGLKDKDGKGKELYHKDLIINYSRNNRKPHIIEWSENKGAWVGKYGELQYLIAEELHEIELVGNIHENPELL